MKPIVWALFFFVVACQAPKAENPAKRIASSTPSAAGAVESAHTPRCAEFMQSLLRVELDRARLARAFGPPDSVLVRSVGNTYNAGAVDSSFTVYYRGLVAKIEKPAGGSEYGSRVVVSDNRYLRYSALGIGSTRDRIVQVLGKPQDQSGDQIVYNCGLGPDEPITFHFTGETVVRIEQEQYVD